MSTLPTLCITGKLEIVSMWMIGQLISRSFLVMIFEMDCDLEIPSYHTSQIDIQTICASNKQPTYSSHPSPILEEGCCTRYACVGGHKNKPHSGVH